MPFVFLLFICLFSNVNGLGQAVDAGLPPLQRFEPKNYKAGASNFATTQDSRGVYFMANEQGVLEFDGQNWRLIPLANRQAARSLAIATDGTVFVGGVGDFGRLRPNAQGGWRFESFKKLLQKDSTFVFDDVWNTHATPEGVYFQTDYALFRWRQGQPLKVWRTTDPFFLSYYCNGKLYIQKRGDAVYQLDNYDFKPVNGLQSVSDKRIGAMVPFDKQQILLATWDAGLYLFDGEKTVKWKNEAEKFLIDNHFYSITALPQGGWACGTLKKGVVYLNSEGKITGYLNAANGLNDELVWNVFLDRNQTLWLSHNNGLTAANLQAAYTLFDDKMGLKGQVLASIKFKKRIYAATTQGLFYRETAENRNLSPTLSAFKPLDGLPKGAVVRNFLIFEEQLLLATDKGVYKMGKGKPEWITKEPATQFFHFLADPRRVWVKTESGLFSILFNKKWKTEPRIKGVDFEVGDYIPQKFITNENGDIYKIDSKSTSREFHLIDLSAKDNIPKHKQSFVLEQGLFINGNIYAYKEDNELLALKNKNGKIISLKNDANFLSCRVNGTLYLLAQNAYKILGLLELNASERYKWIDLAHTNLPNLTANHFWVEDNETVWLSANEGLFRLELSVQKTAIPNAQPLIRRVTANGDSTVFDGVFTKANGDLSLAQITPFEFDASLRSLQFECVQASGQNTGLFQYKLEPFDDEWSDWSRFSTKEYTNLPAGKYVFRVRTQQENGQAGKETVFEFIRKGGGGGMLWVILGVIVMLALIGIGVYFFRKKFVWLTQKEFEAEKLRWRKEAEAAMQTQNRAVQVQYQDLAQQMGDLTTENIKLQNQLDRLCRENLKLEEEIERLKL